MDRTSIIGVLLGLFAIIGGNFIEGGKLNSIFQPTAALIVFGGTFGAVLLSFSVRDILNAFLSLKDIFVDKKTAPGSFIDEIVRYADLARRNGLIVLENELSRISNPYFGRVMMLAVDRMAAKTLRDTIAQENITYEEGKRRVARVFDTAGGIAPTIGILGAVLGLIQVMEHLSDPSKLGAGIAVAFVATIYGVGSANLIFLPMSRKLINKLNYELAFREMILEGVVGIQSGMNPHYLRERLNVFLEERERQSGK
jgi:chemotaxis protein MotA